MYLFAESTGGNSFGFLLVFIFLCLGVRRGCIWFKGNDAIRGAAKKGIINVLFRIFK